MIYRVLCTSYIWWYSVHMCTREDPVVIEQKEVECTRSTWSSKIRQEEGRETRRRNETVQYGETRLQTNKFKASAFKQSGT